MRSIGPAVTREQSPAFLRNSNGRLDFPVKQNNDLRKPSKGEGSVLVWGSHVRLHRHIAYFRQLQACALTLQVQISQEFVFPSLVNADCIFASVESHCWVFRAAAATSCKTDVNTKRPGGQCALNTDLPSQCQGCPPVWARGEGTLKTVIWIGS